MIKLGERAGRTFGFLFAVLACVALGPLYGMPRTGAVSFEMAVEPLVGNSSLLATLAFNLLFFGAALALSWNLDRVVSILGMVLAPALALVLVLLVGAAIVEFDFAPGHPTSEFADSALIGGILQGYLTIDALGALVVGSALVGILRRQGVPEGKSLRRATFFSAVGAGLMLAIVYFGLGLVGALVPDGAGYESGAEILLSASRELLGSFGAAFFGLIVLLACLTTAVGLNTAVGTMMESIAPVGSYRLWCVVLVSVSAVLSTLGLESVFALAIPILMILYPAGIVLIVVVLGEAVVGVRGMLYWGMRLPVWVAACWAGLSLLSFDGAFGRVLDAALSWAPMQNHGLGWIVPTLVALALGILLDHVARDRSTAGAGLDVAVSEAPGTQVKVTAERFEA